MNNTTTKTELDSPGVYLEKENHTTLHFNIGMCWIFSICCFAAYIDSSRSIIQMNLAVAGGWGLLGAELYFIAMSCISLCIGWTINCPRQCAQPLINQAVRLSYMPTLAWIIALVLHITGPAIAQEMWFPSLDVSIPEWVFNLTFGVILVLSAIAWAWCMSHRGKLITFSQVWHDAAPWLKKSN